MASNSQEPPPSTSNGIVDNSKPPRDKQKDVSDVKLALKEYLKDVRENNRTSDEDSYDSSFVVSDEEQSLLSDEEEILSSPSHSEDEDLESEEEIDEEYAGDDESPRKSNPFVLDEASEGEEDEEDIDESSDYDDDASDDSRDRSITKPLSKRDFQDDEAVEDNDLRGMYNGLYGDSEDEDDEEYDDEDEDEDEDVVQGTNGNINGTELNSDDDEVVNVRKSWRTITLSSDDEDQSIVNVDDDNEEEIVVKRKTPKRNNSQLDSEDDGSEKESPCIQSNQGIIRKPDLSQLKSPRFVKQGPKRRKLRHPKVVFLTTELDAPTPTAADLVMFQLKEMRKEAKEKKQLQSPSSKEHTKGSKGNQQKNRYNPISNGNTEKPKILIPQPEVEKLVNENEYVILIDADGVAEATLHCGTTEVFLEGLQEKLTRAFGDRVKSINIIKVKSKDSANVVLIGLISNGSAFLSNVIRGPLLTDRKEAASFRDFWGKYSECRRFDDLAVCEAVYFGAKNMAEKRNICHTIIKIILKRHFNTSPERITVFGADLNLKLLPVSTADSRIPPATDTGDEALVSTASSLEELIKVLRSVKKIPLEIKSVQGISPSFRGCEVFPQNPIGSSPNDFSPHPLEVIIHLESTGKWPDQLNALRAVKGQFSSALAEQIKTQFKLKTRSTIKHVDVMFNGLCFRLILALPREVQLLRQIVTPTGVITHPLEEVQEAEELNFRQEILPKLSSAINAIHTQYLNFGPLVRLVKRWIASQYLSDYVDDVIIELLVAYLFTRDTYPPPGSLFQGLLHFLTFLTTFDFAKQPLIVNLNGEVREDEEKKIRESFLRMKKRPYIFLSTPYDRRPSMLTRMASWKWKHTLGIFQVLLDCACSARQTLLSYVADVNSFNLDSLFKYPVEKSHVIIRLKSNLKNLKPSVTEDAESGEDSESLPTIGFKPFVNYVQLLRKTYDRYALFLFDPFEESKILVYWKEYTFATHPINELLKNPSQEIIINASQTSFTINIEAILESFSTLGDGLVHKIEPLPSNWPLERNS